MRTTDKVMAPDAADGPDQRGMVSVELALGTMAALLVAAMMMWAVSLGIAQMRCSDAALQGARAVARGESVSTSDIERIAPDDARVTVDREGRDVVVTVSVESRFMGLGPVRLTGTGRYPLEPGEK